MLKFIKIQQRFDHVALHPFDALELFIGAVLDDTAVKRRVVKSIVWNMNAFPDEATVKILQRFRECRISNNLDSRVGTRILDRLLVAPHLLKNCSVDTVVYLKELAHSEVQQEQLSWAVDSFFEPSPEAVGGPLANPSLVFDAAVAMLEAFPKALNWCRAASNLLRASYETPDVCPSQDQTLKLLQVLSRIGSDACPAELRALVIKRALMSSSLPISCVLAAVESFSIMGCWNAVGAILLKYHGTLTKASHSAWAVCSEAALKANVQNPSTRRALLKRGAELRGAMSITELELQCRCEQSWTDICVSNWVSIPDVTERLRCLQGAPTCEQLVKFLETSIKVRSHQQIAWVLCNSIVYHVPNMSPTELVHIMRLLRTAKFRHDDLMVRIGLATCAKNFDVALEMFLFCGAFRIYCGHEGNSLVAPAECVLAHNVLVSFSEALVIMRAMLVCAFQHASLMNAMLRVVAPAVDILSAQQLYILAACHRLHENDDNHLTAAIQMRAVQLVGAVI